MARTEATSVRLTPETMLMLKNTAESRGVSQADVIEMAIRKLDEGERPNVNMVISVGVLSYMDLYAMAAYKRWTIEFLVTQILYNDMESWESMYGEDHPVMKSISMRDSLDDVGRKDYQALMERLDSARKDGERVE